MTRVLIVEDEESLADPLAYLLRNIDILHTEEMEAEVMRAASRSGLIDMTGSLLPGIDGYQICQRLRDDGHNEVPILMLTARDSLEDRLKGLRMGADDYLVKPFALSELVARIEAILRRSQGSRTRRLQVADLNYDLDTLHVSRGAQAIKLNPIGLKLLAILMQKSPAVVTREALEEALWGDNCPDSDSLRSHVHQLRQVLDKPFELPLLHTVHGVGYRLAPPLDAN